MFNGLDAESLLIGMMLGLILASATMFGAAWIAFKVQGE